MGPAGESAQLSEREREVVALMADGLTNEAIAGRLEITQKTVEKHVAHVLQKLDVPPDANINRRVAAVVNWVRSVG